MPILSKFHICYARHLMYAKKKSCLFAVLKLPCCVGSDLKIIVIVPQTIVLTGL